MWGVAKGVAQPLTGTFPPPPTQATISYYQLMHMQTAPLPVHFQMLCESSKLYDPGQQYASHVRQLQRGEEPRRALRLRASRPHQRLVPHVSATLGAAARLRRVWVAGLGGGQWGAGPLTPVHRQVPSHAYTERQLQPRGRRRT